MRRLWLPLALLLLGAPLAAADHPGSNPDGSHLGPLGNENLVTRHTDLPPLFDAWAARWPGLVDRMTVGKTTTGFDLLTVRITDESVPYENDGIASGQKLRVYLDGSHHGNEYLASELIIYYLQGILEAAGRDAAVDDYLRRVEIYATPIVNVDGNLLDTRKNSRQVDLNRNYPFHWGEAGASGTLAGQDYRGPSAWSEQETRDNGAFVERLRPDLYITLHSGIAELYWPWGWTKDPSPDHALWLGLEKPFEEATRGAVDAKNGWELYIVSGISDDWAYGELGVAAFTYEVHEDQFVPIYGQPIPQIMADQLAGLDFLVKNVQKLGAWIEVDTSVAGRLVVRNEGWGAAPSVRIQTDAGPIVAGPIAPGGSIDVEAPGRVLGLEYAPLQIPTSPLRTVAIAPLVVEISAPLEVPAPGILVTFLCIVALGLFTRRRRTV